VAYQLPLPSHIRVHNVFHVSVLKKYVYDSKHVINWWDIQVRILSGKSIQMFSLQECFCNTSLPTLPTLPSIFLLSLGALGQENPHQIFFSLHCKPT